MAPTQLDKATIRKHDDDLAYEQRWRVRDHVARRKKVKRVLTLVEQARKNAGYSLRQDSRLTLLMLATVPVIPLSQAPSYRLCRRLLLQLCQHTIRLY